MKLRTRILTISLAVGLAGSFVAGLLASAILSDGAEARLRAEQKNRLEVVSHLLLDPGAQGFSPTQWQNFLTVLAPDSTGRLMIANRGGSVVVSSTGSPDLDDTDWEKGRRAVILKSQPGEVRSHRQGSIILSALRLPATAANSLDAGYVIIAAGLGGLFGSSSVVPFLLTIGVVFLVVSLISSTIITGQVAPPIVSIAETVRRIRDGATTARITARYSSELSNLGSAINGMAEKLGSDITKLERLERVRSEFLGNVSHELRTPIFSLQGFLETLLDGAVDDPSVNRAFLHKALKHAERLNTLLNDLIEISRIESGEMKMSFRYFSIREFLAGIIEEMKPAAEAKGIRLSVESEFDASAKVYGDKARLRQALVNLIDNAIKYTESGGSVACIARAAHSQCELMVRDSGSGIPAEHLPRIFERFYRVDKDRSREVGGTGLGLAIVKHIIEAHGSTINVTSTVGTGSTFSFMLKR